MTSIAAISVQTVSRLPAARAAAPVAAGAVDTDKAAESARRDHAPAAPAVSGAVMAALIELQARGERHEDPHHDRGHDDDHGHRPPVVQSPVPQPPVSEPPPVVTPVPVVAPPASVDLMAPARTIAMIDKRLAEELVSQTARSAFAAASAERRAAATVAQGQAALATLQAVQTDMSAFRAQALGHYEAVRRSTYG